MSGCWRPPKITFLLGASAPINAFSVGHQAFGYMVDIDEGGHVEGSIPKAVFCRWSQYSHIAVYGHCRDGWVCRTAGKTSTPSLGPLYRLTKVSFTGVGVHCTRASLALQVVMSPAGGSRVS